MARSTNTLVTVNGLVKTPNQIEGIRHACKLAISAINSASVIARPGTTLSTLDRHITSAVYRRGGAAPYMEEWKSPSGSFISMNEVAHSGIPDETYLEWGDIFTIDLAVKLDGYYAVKAVTFPIIRITEERSRLCMAAKCATDLAASLIKPGMKITDIGANIEEFVDGIPGTPKLFVVNDLHGFCTGVDLHEMPDVPYKRQKNCTMCSDLEPGMVLTVGPVVSMGSAYTVNKKDGWHAVTMNNADTAQYTQTVLVTKNGSEILTKSDLEKSIDY